MFTGASLSLVMLPNDKLRSDIHSTAQLTEFNMSVAYLFIRT